MASSNGYGDTSDYNELFLAVHNGELELVHSLLEKYSATETIRGRTLLHVAIARGHLEIAKMFITKRDGDGNTLLHLAISENQPEAFNLLLEDSNLNARNLKDERPLHYAALYNRPEFAKTLIVNDASIGVKDSKGKTPLDVALAKGNVQVAELLFKHGAVLSENDLTNMRPLRNAVEKGNFEMVKLLMAKGCNKVDIPNDDSDFFPKSSLKLAVSSGRLDILKYLVKNGVKSIATVKEDKLCLFRSLIHQGSLDTLECLVDIGIKVKNLDDVFNDTFNSCRHDMWKYLVTKLSKLSAKTYFKEKQLHFSIRTGQVETVKAMVNEPSNAYESNTFAKKLAVYIAVENGSEEILEILLNARYPVTGSLFKCISPLHLAATFEHPRLVKLFLKAGADVNLRTEDYRLTPLHFAAMSAQPAVVKFLLNHGADPSITSKFNESPLKAALEVHSGSYYPIPVTPLVFDGLVKVTDMLIQYLNSETNERLFAHAVGIRVSSSINNSKPVSRELISTVGDFIFRPEIIRCITNYLSEEEVKDFSETFLLEESGSSHYPPELLQLMMEYNDSKSCFDIEINTWNKNNKCQLLLISYSKNVRNLSDTITEIIDSCDEDDDNDVEKKIKIDLLKLLVCRLVLLDKDCNLTDCEEHELIDDLIDWRKKCLKEKRVMQKSKVNKNLNFTFYDVLTKSIDNVAMYANNDDFLIGIKSSQIKFPAYADFLKTNVEMAERRRNFINECTTLMYRLVEKCYKIRISNSDIRHILQYLSIVDLRKFAAACS
ncbi:ankyrin repeat, PH and SEC7 domain containing protein secG-like isoform X1 [Leptopilina heterotoma]|uniref:ankyrin repeat, PH and SEC7 domain containing protein secG-like isoform X1 n=1 Tax=Leptopilina heterotoma TaxID=63436 RepID=UPI001CA7E21F|nr:ankyrin repeat, PH and SEC7 domain containing protein secG-like isoform X1 [Leptopilina heterotoma]